MKVELELYSVAELNAFAAFCSAVAIERAAEPKDRTFALAGLVDRAEKSLWKVAEYGNGEAPVAEQEGLASGDKRLVVPPYTPTPPTPMARERGKPSAGHTKRTKAEIAEDKAADEADAKAAQVEPGIRTDPKNRIPGEEQDAADEAAETAAITTDKKVLTIEAVRTALGKYVQKFGMEAAQQDCPKIITLVCGEGKVKMSDVPDDPAVIARVVAGIEEAIQKDPYERTALA